MRGDQQPAGVVSRRAVAFLIETGSLAQGFHSLPFLLAWGINTVLGGGEPSCDNGDGSYTLGEGGVGSWVPEESSSSCTSVR